MVLSDRVWSTSASSNWGTDEVHGLIWAAEVCWPADRRRPDSRRPWQSVASGSADDGTSCGSCAMRVGTASGWAWGMPCLLPHTVWKAWVIGLVLPLPVRGGGR